MVSALDRAKRALVALIRTLAVLYGCAQNLTREASDSDVKKAYKNLSRKVHPDKEVGKKLTRRF